MGAPRPAQGGALEVPPHGGESGAQLPPGARRRAAAGPPAGTFLRHSPAPARRAAAASRGGRQRGACALTRSRPGPWALPGGWEVGTWEGAGPHTLPASRWRRRHLAARAPRDARRMSRPGKRAGTACGPVGGSPPQPAAPRDHRPPKLNLARRGPGAGSRGQGRADCATPRGVRSARLRGRGRGLPRRRARRSWGCGSPGPLAALRAWPRSELLLRVLAAFWRPASTTWAAPRAPGGSACAPPGPTAGR